MTIRRKSEFKQMSFETAVRNPERYKGIIEIISNYEGQQLNDDVILKIVSHLYLEGEVSSQELIITSDSNIKNIKSKVIEINDSRRADGGFPKGYQSRFWTYMRTLSELGFVYARYGEKLILSEVAKLMLKGIIDEQEAFSIQAIRSNRKSPYRNISNDYNYFEFITNVMIKLSKENRKLSYNQFVVSLFSENGDVDDFIKLISENSLPDKNSTFEFISSHFGKVNSFTTVMNDYPDVVLRLLRITGFVTISYKGIVMLELNELKKDYIFDLLSLDRRLNEEAKTHPNIYFSTIGNYDDKFKGIILKYREKDITQFEHNNILDQIISEYNLSLDDVIKNIRSIGTKQVDSAFKYIPDPLKLEFFISLLMYQKYGDVFGIKPNYKIDSNGLPISHAPGNIGDIELISDNIYWLLEVTLIRNKMQQINNETVNLFRHLSENHNDKTNYLSLVAPYVHDDTEEIFRSSTISNILKGKTKKLYACPFSIEDFLDTAITGNHLDRMKNYTNDLIKCLTTLNN
jgi:hypothetical protein